jgi:peptide/nickel transport system substrate-binding protein
MPKALLWVATVLAALVIAACGGGGDEEAVEETNVTPDGGGNVTEQLFAGTARDNMANPEAGGKKGGSLTVLSAGDVDYLDPQKTYYQYAIGIINALHRGLYAYPPSEELEAVPDLAESAPEVSSDGKTVTVKIREGVRFSPPVNREVTSKDVKYGIERAFQANVANGYARVYFKDIVGVPEKPGPFKALEGITTPDDQTIVFTLTQGTGATLAAGLVMPISVPVPREFAQRYDRGNPSTYGEEAAVYTGPYMVESDAEGRATGYVAGKSLKLVRNPNYENIGDFRPAYLDEIEFRAGNTDDSVATRRVLSGENLALGDTDPPTSQLRRLLQDNKSEISATSGGGFRTISMDTSRPPFNDINVRKAVIAGFDRVAARQQRGGEALGPVAQHLIPPGMAGFEESNGVEGWASEMDWLAKPEGDRALSAEYFKKAGFASGRFEGKEKVLVIGETAEPAKSISQILDQQLREMGFQTTLRMVTRDTAITRFCGASDSDGHVCANYGWGLDFNDPQTILDPTFHGDNILKAGNVNWSELDVPEVNKAIDDAKLVTDPAERAKAWAAANKLIMEQASVIPYMWDYGTTAISPNMRGVQNPYHTTWDWNFTSLR